MFAPNGKPIINLGDPNRDSHMDRIGITSIIITHHINTQTKAPNSRDGSKEVVEGVTPKHRRP